MSVDVEWRQNALIGQLFQFDYSLKFKEITKHTTKLGYFHDLKLSVVAKNLNDAVEMLKLWHDDGVPEGIRVTELGQCVKRPNAI
jgi:hypothetical protein